MKKDDVLIDALEENMNSCLQYGNRRPYTGIDTAAGQSMTGYKAKDLLPIGEAIVNGIRDGLKEGISH